MKNFGSTAFNILPDHADIFESLTGNEKWVVCRNDYLGIALAESAKDRSEVARLRRMLIEFGLLARENKDRPFSIIRSSKLLE